MTITNLNHNNFHDAEERPILPQLHGQHYQQLDEDMGRWGIATAPTGVIAAGKVRWDGGEEPLFRPGVGHSHAPFPHHDSLTITCAAPRQYHRVLHLEAVWKSPLWCAISSSLTCFHSSQIDL